jgi:hypothetical protein
MNAARTLAATLVIALVPAIATAETPRPIMPAASGWSVALASADFSQDTVRRRRDSTSRDSARRDSTKRDTMPRPKPPQGLLQSRRGT